MGKWGRLKGVGVQWGVRSREGMCGVERDCTRSGPAQWEVWWLQPVGCRLGMAHERLPVTGPVSCQPSGHARTALCPIKGTPATATALEGQWLVQWGQGNGCVCEKGCGGG